MSFFIDKPSVEVRVLGTQGHYPAFEIRSPTHLYLANKNLVWTAVIQPVLAEDWWGAETTRLTPEEVRLMSAIALCERDPWEKGRPIIALWTYKHVEPRGADFSLTNPTTIRELEQVALSLGTGPLGPRVPGTTERYSVKESLGSLEDAIALLEGIDVENQLLLAGLARLLGATRLISVAHEPEEGAISLFVSMGAALELIRGHLCEAAGTDVGFSGVYDYFRRTFPAGDDWAEYYQERNEERIIAIHPSNRFGDFWAPALMMDDVYHLQQNLLALYRHIILGEIPED